jgi:OOP family OmpA-OmpF porin
VTAANPAVQNLTVDDDDMAVAWQAIAGASIKATDKLKIDFTYRYMTAPTTRGRRWARACCRPGNVRRPVQGPVADRGSALLVRVAASAAPAPAASPAAAASASAASPAAAASAAAAV